MLFRSHGHHETACDTDPFQHTSSSPRGPGSVGLPVHGSEHFRFRRKMRNRAKPAHYPPDRQRADARRRMTGSTLAAVSHVSEPLLSGYTPGQGPRVPSPLCKVCFACKFGSCHASFIFVRRRVYPLTSSAALRAGFPVAVRSVTKERDRVLPGARERRARRGAAAGVRGTVWVPRLPAGRQAATGAPPRTGT